MQLSLSGRNAGLMLLDGAADVNPDWRAEQRRVDERVEREAKVTASGAQYFWSDTPKAKVPALMLDRVWRAAMLLLGCQKTLSRLHRVMFPHNPQPQGVPALMDMFRDGAGVKQAVHAQLVGGANIALAYFRKHRPYFNLEKVVGGLPDQEHYAESLPFARRMVEDVQRHTERLVGPLDAPKDEPV